MAKHALPLPGTAREAILRGLLSQHRAGPPLCAARGQNASRWWLCCCSAAKRPACVWLSSVALSQGPASSSRPQKEKHLFSLAWHREGAILLLLMLPAPECFHFVFADGRCPLSSSAHQPGAGGGEATSIRFIPFPDTLLHPRYQIAAGAVTLWQTFLSWMSGCVTH